MKIALMCFLYWIKFYRRNYMDIKYIILCKDLYPSIYKTCKSFCFCASVVGVYLLYGKMWRCVKDGRDGLNGKGGIGRKGWDEGVGRHPESCTSINNSSNIRENMLNMYKDIMIFFVIYLSIMYEILENSN